MISNDFFLRCGDFRMEIQLGKLWRGLSVDLHKNPQLLGYTLLISMAEGWGRDYEGIIHPRVAFTVGFIMFFQSTEWCFFLWVKNIGQSLSVMQETHRTAATWGCFGAVSENHRPWFYISHHLPLADN